MMKQLFISFGLATLSALAALAATPTTPIEMSAGLVHKQMVGPFNSLSEVTVQCLACHPGQGEDILRSSHWTWKRSRMYNGKEQVFSKKNGLTTFAIAAGGNPAQCLTCHISGNLLDERFDPTSSVNIDCLVCHDTTGSYRREGGKVAQEVNLVYVVKNVGRPAASNCMTCHGTGEKTSGMKIHGGIEQDIHLQPDGAAMNCQQCHPSGDRHTFTRLLSSAPGYNQTKGCAVCHTATPHRQQRLNRHAEIIDCKTCHIPKYGLDEPALFSWNWLDTATPPLNQLSNGTVTRLVSDNGVHQARSIQPVYLWDDGTDILYMRGDKVRKESINVLQQPSPRTAVSKIAPFTAAYGTQMIDAKFRYLISPSLSENGTMQFKGGNWDTAAGDGMTKLRLPFSGEAAFTSTLTYGRLNHGVVGAEQALDCMDCHGKNNRINWHQLGYTADPWQDNEQRIQPVLKKSAEDEEQVSLPPIREMVLPVEPES